MRDEVIVVLRIFAALCESLTMKLIILSCFVMLSHTQPPPSLSLPVKISVLPPWHSLNVSQGDLSLIFTNSSPFSYTQSMLLIPPVGTDSKPVLHATFGPYSVTQLVSDPLASFSVPLVAYLLSKETEQTWDSERGEDFTIRVLFHMKGLCAVTMTLPKDWFKPDQTVQPHQSQNFRRHQYRRRSRNRIPSEQNFPASLRAKHGISSDMIQLYYSSIGSMTNHKISPSRCVADKQSQRNLYFIGSVALPDKENKNNKPIQGFSCSSEVEQEELWLNSNVLIYYNKGPVQAGQPVGVSLNLRANFSGDFLIVKLKLKKGLLSLRVHPNKNSHMWAVKVEKTSSSKHNTISIISHRTGAVVERSGTLVLQLVACLSVEGIQSSFRVAMTVPVNWWVVDTMHDKLISPYGAVTTFFSFTDREIVGIAPITERNTIMNTAILSSQPVSLPVIVLAVGQDGKVLDITAAVNCQSTNEDIVKVSSDCSAVYVDGSESGVGSTCVEVEYSLGIFTSSLCLAVWAPVVPLHISLSDTVLSPIEGWSYYTDSRCTPVYQRATIQVFAQFRAHSAQGLTYMLGSPDWFVDVTDLVRDSLRIENSCVAALHEQNYVIGLEPGVTSLNLISNQWDGVLGTVDVTVTSEPVAPGDLSVHLVGGLGLLVASSSSNPSVITATVMSHNTLYNYGQEASFSVWLQFGDDTAILLTAFSEFPFSLHLSSLAESVVAITPAPLQRVLAQGDGGGPLVKAELLVSTCELVSTHIKTDEIKERSGTRRLAKGSGWIRVNLDAELWPLESEDVNFEMTSALDTFAKLNTNVYHNSDQKQATLKSTNYADKTSNDMNAWDDLENAVLTPNHKDDAVNISPDIENRGRNTNRHFVLGVGAVFILLCLSFILFFVKFMPCVVREPGKRQSKEMRKHMDRDKFTQEEDNDKKSEYSGTW
ncbi:transmembrane protein 132C isoform X2 [Silurus meridionalis]|uniref:transmembrane protein 132C isoform X2 n=1 Tax=Silurus meridionalis TaxID=175797 RepID=UPI001EE9E2C9|nr:transmembrane protein 132C isoform X2 [Silurus meridionalis]